MLVPDKLGLQDMLLLRLILSLKGNILTTRFCIILGLSMRSVCFPMRSMAVQPSRVSQLDLVNRFGKRFLKNSECVIHILTCEY